MSDMNGVRVLERAISILSRLASCEQAMGLSELSRATDLSKATAFRILSTLADRDLVIKDARGAYQIGPGVLAWASGFRRQSALIEIARPILEKINREVSETVHLFSFEKGRAFYVDKVESTQPVRLQAVVGGSPVLYATSAGRSVLANLPREEFEAYLAATPLAPRTPHTCVDEVAFRVLIEAARKRGYAEEDQQNEEGIRCVGAAILRDDGYPIGALSITAPRYRFLDEMVEPFGLKVWDAAIQISQRFGYVSKPEN